MEDLVKVCCYFCLVVDVLARWYQFKTPTQYTVYQSIFECI
jgi:hypothetical protein